MQHLELHPLCSLFPRITGAEFDSLRDDIAANGLRQPITIHKGMILDGGNRYRACIDAGVEPTLVEFAGGNLVSFVLSQNMHRRHLSAGQQAAIVASAQDWSKAQPAGGDRRSDQSATLHLETVADRAAQSGASERTQKMADKVARQDPALARQVAHGEISLPKAHEQVSTPLPKILPRNVPPAREPAPTIEAEIPASIDAPATKPPRRIEIAGRADRDRVVKQARKAASILREMARKTEQGIGAVFVIDIEKTIKALAEVSAVVVEAGGPALLALPTASGRSSAELEAENAELLASNTEMAYLLEGTTFTEEGSEVAAKEIARLNAQLHTVESQRDGHMVTGNEMKREIKSFRRQLDKAKGATTK